ncbi:hypothetical protein GSU68_11360 [Rathayibacter sp. VKM Ac-2759]|uniref:O-antigen ligase family protein n=1 Tax=Rathayibacter sp. VKM Ac-2759 TaxID=2609252 RepID=UPI0013172DDC|nr:O-antigen ligase family protein [Rathayibacter sp. VKM Ac-2759]QHC67102.1 hypothetical protein GSU68_11360 [Rathayibacter sp. VKM Ac-2759]
MAETRHARRPFLVGTLVGTAAGVVGVQINALGPFQGLSIVFVALALLAAMSWTDRFRLSKIRLSPMDYSFVALLVVWALIELINASELRHSPFLGVLITVGISYLASIPVRMVVRGPSDLSPFLRGFALPGVAVSIIAVAQLLRVPGVNAILVQYTNSAGLAERLTSGWDIRGTSTIGHWTALGGYLACVIAATCVDLIISRNGPRLAAWPVVVLAILFAGSITTLTFAVVGTSAVIIALTALRLKIRPVLVISSLGVAFAGWTFFGQSIADRLEQQSGQSPYVIAQYAWLPQTIGYRVNIWVTETLPAIDERLLTGWGAQVYSAALKNWPVSPQSLVWVSPESEWMRTLVASGVVGLFVEIVLLVAAFAALRRSRRALGAAAVAPIMVLLVCLLLISSIHSHLSNPGVPLALWPLVFAVATAAARARPDQVVAESRAPAEATTPRDPRLRRLAPRSPR